MGELFWRAALFCGCCSLALYFGFSLSNQSEQKDQLKERVEMLRLKQRRLEQSDRKKRAWLASGKQIDAQDIAAHLSELRLCEAALDLLMQNAFHPFLKDPEQLTALLDKLDHNQIQLQELSGEYTLVRPVYMEQKDLEKMIEIIENEGAFSPVEIKELDFKKESLLGGELWRVEHLVFGRVDADGALPS